MPKRRSSEAPPDQGAAGRSADDSDRAGSKPQLRDVAVAEDDRSGRAGDIVEAAADAFIEHGFDGARIDDIAARAGVSKGLPFLYFKTKEGLFKAVLRSILRPRLLRMTQAIDDPTLTVQQFLQGPFAVFAHELVGSRKAAVIRLMIAEGPKHPELLAFHAEEVLRPTLAALTALLDRGVARGEIAATGLNRHPQLLVAPVMVATLWQLLFQKHIPIDRDDFIDSHIDLLLRALAPEAAHNNPHTEPRP